MKRIIFLILVTIMAATSSMAQLPNGFRANYTLVGSYDANGNEINNGAPKCAVMIVTTNFGFGPQSSAIATLDFGFVGNTTLSFDGYVGMQNGWHVYVSNMGIAGQNYLLISRDGSSMRYINNFGGGDSYDYRIN